MHSVIFSQIYICACRHSTQIILIFYCAACMLTFIYLWVLLVQPFSLSYSLRLAATFKVRKFSNIKIHYSLPENALLCTLQVCKHIKVLTFIALGSIYTFSKVVAQAEQQLYIYIVYLACMWMLRSVWKYISIYNALANVRGALIGMRKMKVV